MLKQLPLSGWILTASLLCLNVGAADIRPLVQKTKPAIVEIVAFDKENKPLATGTGFFISPDSLLLTNNHVIAGASSIQILHPDPQSDDPIEANALSVRNKGRADFPEICAGIRNINLY
jgi:S1-C subfamily serine protease